MEKELGISGKKEIEELGIAKFNESCRSIVLRYTAEWRRSITRSGRWVDFDNDYKTMDPAYMESIWWVVKRLWDKNLLKEDYYILPYCPRCSTSLSNFELNLGGYEDVKDPAITVRFRLSDEPDTYILAWTTTPWTLPSNLGLVFGKDIDYVKIADGPDIYILAKDRLPFLYRDPSEVRILSEFKGSAFEGRTYEPLFPFFSHLAEKGAFRTFLGDFVSTEEGTGIVHIAPGFGEDDFNLLKGTGVPTVCPVDAEGHFTDEVSDYAGLYVKDADAKIMEDLKREGKLVRRATQRHAYPHCWRCKSPLIYRAITSWFVRIDRIKDAMLSANDQIRWVPQHLKRGRFGKWLEGARDWAISRNRYWGNPIPIWRCPSCDETLCLGSRRELEEKSGRTVEDLHKHFIDDIHIPCSRCRGQMTRIPEVLDCWFESGAMPYGQNHYPFENKEHFESHFPADFIAEGLDQTRGWFYTLVVLGAALFDKPAFKSVVVNGLVLTEDGTKMSKSERNYTDPSDVMDNFGADGLRLFLIDSAVARAEDLKYSDSGVKEVLKNVIIPLWNAYSFFVTYANIDGADPRSHPDDPANPLDRWILSEAERMTGEVTRQMERYDLQRAVEPFIAFIDLLNNWYIRRSRRRFWRSQNDLDKEQAYQTLYSVLRRLTLVAAPFIPFITEEIHRNLRSEGVPESIHLCDYPEEDEGLRDGELERKMAVVRQAVSMGRAIRSLHNLKIRQPLKAIYLVTKNQEERRILIELADIIEDELNVKEVVFRENEEELVTYSASPNYRKLGKHLGKAMPLAARRIEALSGGEVVSLMEGSTLSIDLTDSTDAISGHPGALDLSLSDVTIARREKENLKVLNEGSLTVALDAEITEELKQEGMIRDMVRAIQNLRREEGLQVTDRIGLSIHGSEKVREALKTFGDYLMGETLASSWNWKREPESKAISCGDEPCFISLTKDPTS
jgi:isoleucyl-tRNA synthetase